MKTIEARPAPHASKEVTAPAPLAARDDDDSELALDADRLDTERWADQACTD
jgi:hypothetical protein